jgi:hypothetical protein
MEEVEEGGEREAERVTLAWTAHPLLRRPGRGSVAAAVILVSAVLIGHFTRSAFWGLFTVGVLFLSLEGFFLPTRYEIQGEVLILRKAFSRSALSWSAFRRVYEDRFGLTLSPFRRRTFLEPYRSARILFDGGEAEAIKRAVRERCGEAEWISPAGKGKES